MSYNPLYQSHRPFLCVDSFFKPARGVKTEKKGWHKEPRNWATDEVSYVVDRVSNKIVSRASIIIDLVEDKLVKTRYVENPAEDIIAHYRRKYADKISQAMEIWEVRKRMVNV